MTAKKILDAFSETLMQDERILTPRERELLTSLLQNSKTVSNNSPEIQSAVSAAIARSIGETVAQRSFALLGSSIVDQILAGSGMTEQTAAAATVEMGSPQPPGKPTPPPSPQPPGTTPPGPQPPGTSQPLSPQPPGKMSVPPSPKPPGKPPRPPSPQPPGSPSPQPPGALRGLRPLSVPVQQGTQPIHSDANTVGVLEASAMVRPQCVVLDEFLAPQELDELMNFALQHEPDFRSSEVISPSGDPGVTDYTHRRSQVLMDLGKHQEIILERIRGVLPSVLDQMGVEEFPVTDVEAQITASTDGDFFNAHSDDAQETVASRRITFVYFFHREPRPFEGGELRLHDSRAKGQSIEAGSYQSISPRQNQIVFFPCSVMHEITPVECPSKAFADSRFTLNGWLHK